MLCNLNNRNIFIPKEIWKLIMNWRRIIMMEDYQLYLLKAPWLSSDSFKQWNINMKDVLIHLREATADIYLFIEHTLLKMSQKNNTWYYRSTPILLDFKQHGIYWEWDIASYKTSIDSKRKFCQALRETQLEKKQKIMEEYDWK